MTNISKFFLIFIGVFIVDQFIKYLFVNGFGVEGECISLVLAYNNGVAFSILSSLGEYLKYFQLLLIFAMIVVVFIKKEIIETYAIGVALILSGGISNLLDRFLHDKGVVDYIYWHCSFDFAIFNFADMMINLGAAIILIQSFTSKKK